MNLAMLETLVGEFSAKNGFCNGKIYSWEMSSFGYLRCFGFFFSVFHQKYKIGDNQSALDCAVINGDAAVRQGSCDKTCCVRASGERAARVGRGKAAY